jgi:nitric oxide reductase activation protein
VLLDVSGSAAEPGVNGHPVHDQQSQAAAALVHALGALGDRVALHAFRSMGRSDVQVIPIRRFGESAGSTWLRRLGAVTPGAYTRVGAAIRHSAAVLDREAATNRRLLVVLSDGFAYDHGYGARYGEADARRALLEARRAGIGCLCLSIGGVGEPDALRRVFGTAAHAAVRDLDELPLVVRTIFSAALRSADSQRRRWRRDERSKERIEVDRRVA